MVRRPTKGNRKPAAVVASSVLGLALAALALMPAQRGALAGDREDPATSQARLGRAIVAPAPSAAVVTIDLCATTGSVTMPDAAVVPIWGFALKHSGVDCSDPSVEAQLPGPTLVVDEGDTVTVSLYNNLAVNVSITFPQLELLPDLVGVAPGGNKAYAFTADRPGTFLYESGVVARESGAGNTSCSDGIDNDGDLDIDADDLDCANGNDARIQVPMGLYGPLVVRPTSGANFAYNDAATEFDVESMLVLGEVDPALHADPDGFDMQNYAPTYWLISGKAYPDTEEIEAAAGDRVLFRYLNASISHHVMALAGFHETVIAGDGYPLNFSYEAVSLTVASGQTMDAIGTVPPGATSGSKFALYSANLHVTNVNSFPGGMLTFVVVP